MEMGRLRLFVMAPHSRILINGVLLAWAVPVNDIGHIGFKPALPEGEMALWQRKTPLEWLTFINKEVKVLAAEKHTYQGWVLTVDPVSANILLANPLENGKMQISAILGHAVQDVEVLTEADEEMKEKLVHLFVPEESQTYSQEELETKKNSLKTWLEKNHIPVKERGESQTTLCVAGVLTIDPPYRPEDCNSSNEIILSRIQGLIQGYLTDQ